MATEINGTIQGVQPPILLEQVRNTAPFIFTDQLAEQLTKQDKNASLENPRYEYLNRLRALAEKTLPGPLPHLDYFTLCLSAHYATVATFVPTDVDNQIRYKLWHPTLPTETLCSMADIVLRSRSWDTRPVSTRWISSRKNPALILSGHDGEWLSTAAAAYGSLRRRAPEKAAEIAGEILRELHHASSIYEELLSARDGVALLKAATLIAHNLGDLDRVLDLWNLTEDDPLKIAVYKAGHSEAPSDSVRNHLLQAGQLNKAMMAVENHRHFALRSARALRRCADCLIPLGPFFDDWGARIARHRELSLEEKGSVAEALIHGWEHFSGKSSEKSGGKPDKAKAAAVPVGYARALAGMIEAFPGGERELFHYLPAKLARTVKSGPLRALCTVPKNRFEEQWAQAALRFCLANDFKPKHATFHARGFGVTSSHVQISE